VKQNLPAAKTTGWLVISSLVAAATFIAACARLPMSARSDGQRTAAAERAGQVNLNTATATELEKLPGVGKVIAERIVAYREQYGPFRRAEHLMMVRGISDNKFRQLRSLITVDAEP
jgi:competence ComEA-like helix-hairpin-helix protein